MCHILSKKGYLILENGSAYGTLTVQSLTVTIWGFQTWKSAISFGWWGWKDSTAHIDSRKTFHSVSFFFFSCHRHFIKWLTRDGNAFQFYLKGTLYRKRNNSRSTVFWFGLFFLYSSGYGSCFQKNNSCRFLQHNQSLCLIHCTTKAGTSFRCRLPSCHCLVSWQQTVRVSSDFLSVG